MSFNGFKGDKEPLRLFGLAYEAISNPNEAAALAYRNRANAAASEGFDATTVQTAALFVRSFFGVAGGLVGLAARPIRRRLSEPQFIDGEVVGRI